MQILHVSTSNAGNGFSTLGSMPGGAHRDLALQVSGSQGISKVFAIARVIYFTIEE